MFYGSYQMLLGLLHKGWWDVFSMWEMRNGYEICVGIPEGKIRFGRVWHIWLDNIKVDL
jgi:hypothetical protein